MRSVIFYVGLGAAEVRGAELVIQEGHERVAQVGRDRHPQEPSQ